MKKNTKQTLAQTNRKLAREWHPTKNAPLTPKDVTLYSRKRIWWVCDKGHEWETAIKTRHESGTGCPYCSGRRVNKDNCLETVNSRLAREWHSTKNAPLTPRDVTAGAGRKVWWHCSKGHEWEAVVYSRSEGHGCPYCSGFFVCKDNCLHTTRPKLAEEWHPAKNAPLTAKDVTLHSNKKVWWVCRKGHEWKAYINSRSTGIRCPCCTGWRASVDNCLQTMNPMLAREWHPTNNVPLTPKDVLPGSQLKAWWICRKGHEWRSSVSNRSRGIGCPYCSGQRVCKDNCLQTVKPMLAREWHPTKNTPLTPKDVTAGTDKAVWWACRKGHEWKAVIGSRSRGIGCPYCSGHRVFKDNCLQTVNPKLAKEWHPAKNAPLTPKDVTLHSGKKAWWMCRNGHEWEAVIYNRSDGRGCPYCSGRRVCKDNCLQTVNPKLAKEWHSAKNAPLTPKDVTLHSGKKAWWVCRKGHEWEAVIYDRSSGIGCPYCSGHRVCKDTCLQTVNPKLAKEWHPAKNAPLTPKDVTLHSNKRAWWMCGEGHEWDSTIGSRAKGTECPYCSGHRASKVNSLETKGPWLAREWHPTKNGSWTPKDVAPYSQRQVWWKCKEGHEARESVSSRSQRGGCPVCVLKRKAPQLFERSTCRT